MSDVADDGLNPTAQADDTDREANRLSGRVRRYGQIGTGVGGVAARIAIGRLTGRGDDERFAAELTKALGGLKGPLMKVAQLLTTIPDAVPPEYAEELSQLQNHAPPMGWPFVKRRMAAELGSDWKSKFGYFERDAANSASLGQVHRATSLDGEPIGCKLQYPDMQSAVEADLNQLKILMSVHKRYFGTIDSSQIGEEISERLREELDYELEASHMRLYGLIFADDETIRIPQVLDKISTKRLLSMTWLDGTGLLTYKNAPLEDRNQIARAMFRAWWHPFSQYGIIHGDPHLGNYNVWENEDGRPQGINLLDYGCMRTFKPKFIKGVIELYHGLLHQDRDQIVHAYELWGFNNLSNELIDVLNIWAEFINAPLLDDRVRTVADGVSPGEYGRKQVFQVHQELKKKGPVTVPREFVFMDRAAIGLGGVFLHLDAKMNFYRMFNETIEGADFDSVKSKQADAFRRAGVPLPR